MIRGGNPGRALALTALVLACAVGLTVPTRSASVEIEPGLLFHFHASIAPRTVSASASTPVALTFAASPRKSDGTAAPSLRSLTLDLDRKVSFDFGNREACSFGGRAIRAPFPARCRSAIVGRGRLAGAIPFQGQEPVPFDVPTIVFNWGVPGGDTTLGLFALARTPVQFTLLRPIQLHKRAEGPFGYRAKLTIPPIPLNGTLSDLEVTMGLPPRGDLGGTLTMQCDGNGTVQIRAQAELADGARLEAQSVRACKTAA